MASFNRVIMIGNLTRDPDYKQLGSGQAVCRLGLASNRQFKNRQTDETTQEVCYIDIDVWGAQAESCRQHLQKGRLILVEGRLKLSTWETDGQTKSKHSIVADRVTFLSQNQGDRVDSSSQENNSSEGVTSETKVTKSETKTRPTSGATKKNTAPASSGGEISFSDQKPFEDDLPF